MNVQGGLLHLSAFRNLAYIIYYISGILCFFGLCTVTCQCYGGGRVEQLFILLVAIVNATTGLGRLSAGLLADRIGPLNVMIPFTGLVGILTFAWPYASSRGALVAISVIYGFASGTYVSLLLAPPMAIGDVGDVERRVGMFLTIAALGTLVGVPISGAINTRTGDFKDSGVYAGGAVTCSVLLLFVV
ncbi:hypothetical protein BKA82DRAFT_4237407 [Pisolithus tinctorius]|nr:hypothetical protein BKA82DRAFT_4237407 [Pisolithus tinctorius]